MSVTPPGTAGLCCERGGVESVRYLEEPAVLREECPAGRACSWCGGILPFVLGRVVLDGRWAAETRAVALDVAHTETLGVDTDSHIARIGVGRRPNYGGQVELHNRLDELLLDEDDGLVRLKAALVAL